MLKPVLRPIPLMLLAALIVGIFSISAPRAAAQQRPATQPSDQPMSYTPNEMPAEEESSGFVRFLESVCWYLPNRVVDLFDIPAAYITFPEGMGASIRATKYLNASWFHDDTFGIGWNPRGRRNPPFFGENINEKYFGFLAAQQGEIQRDPSEVGLSFHFLVLGANAGVSINEAVDFVLGFVGLDLRGDDFGPYMYGDPKAE